MTAKNKPVYVYQKMSKLGIALWLLGTMRIHKDGDGLCSVFRWWNPLSLVLWVVMLVPCALLGERINEVVPFALSKYWKKNYAQLRWVHPFERLDAIGSNPFPIRVPRVQK